jgi:hypothetical protein
MRVKVSQWDQGKGALLEEVFEDQDGIAFSEQGKSFTAFWRFLMSLDTREAFQQNLEAVLKMLPVQQMALPSSVRDIQSDWIEAGAYVQTTVASLNAQLRRYIDDNYLSEERRIMQLVREIESKALKLADQAPRDWNFTIEAPKVQLNMTYDRPLWSHRAQPELKNVILQEDDQDIDLGALYDFVYVDTALLEERIERNLQTRDQVTLSELLLRYPLEKGLSELLAYLTIAAQRAQRAEQEHDIEQALVPAEEAEYTWLDDHGKQRSARMPELVFTRAKHLTGVANG